jgi:formate/nitrite transporter FocA (FNT family)
MQYASFDAYSPRCFSMIVISTRGWVSPPSTGDVLFNWAIVCAANFVGAAGLALLVFLSGCRGSPATSSAAACWWRSCAT